MRQGHHNKVEIKKQHLRVIRAIHIIVESWSLRAPAGYTVLLRCDRTTYLALTAYKGGLEANVCRSIMDSGRGWLESQFS